ncbi:MAG: NADH oxidase [Bacteroidia bacterium]|nr:MAG: NADH oxidase [Bacteroidia bacterium]
MKRTIVVIGGLAAGPAAAAKAKRVDPSASVVLLEAGETISYGICEIPFAVGGTIRALSDLVLFTPERFEAEKGVVVRTLHRVERIHPTRRILEVRSFEKGATSELGYDRLILAMGSQPKPLGMPGEEARNVFTVKSFSGAAALEHYIIRESPRRAVIVGGGYIGMEMAEALTLRGLECTVLHRHSLPMWGLEDAPREAVALELEKHGVKFVGNTAVRGFDVSRFNTVTRVRTDTASFETDLVIMCIGVEPQSALASEAGIEIGARKGILTDQRQVTSVDGIYAAGDCCEVRNLITNKWMYAPLATIAARQGRVAGENAAGGSAVFKGALRSVAVRVFSLEVARVGLSSQEALEQGFEPAETRIESDSRIPFFPGNARVSVILIADRKSGRLLGGNVYGGDGAVLRANTLALAIQCGLTARELTETDLIYSPPFSPLWDPLLIAGNRLHHSLRSNEKPDPD